VTDRKWADTVSSIRSRPPRFKDHEAADPLNRDRYQVVTSRRVYQATIEAKGCSFALDNLAARLIGMQLRSALKVAGEDPDLLQELGERWPATLDILR
jgi:hypothetical protein